MSVAVAKGDVRAMLWAIVAMITMIVVLDQLLWRPVVVWSQKFRVEEGADEQIVVVVVLRLVATIEHHRLVGQRRRRSSSSPANQGTIAAHPQEKRALEAFIARCACSSFSSPRPPFRQLAAVRVLRQLSARAICRSSAHADGRSGACCSRPRSERCGRFRPAWRSDSRSVCREFSSRSCRSPLHSPAPMLFPLVIAILKAAGVSLGWGSVVLMLLGTQWYILFNVIAGAMAIPADLREAARSYRLSRPLRFRSLYLPAVFPYLVTGWVTAAGGAWNASIVAEYVTFKGQVLTANGLGAQISLAAEHADFPAARAPA